MLWDLQLSLLELKVIELKVIEQFSAVLIGITFLSPSSTHKSCSVNSEIKLQVRCVVYTQTPQKILQCRKAPFHYWASVTQAFTLILHGSQHEASKQECLVDEKGCIPGVLLNSTKPPTSFFMLGLFVGPLSNSIHKTMPYLLQRLWQGEDIVARHI